MSHMGEPFCLPYVILIWKNNYASMYPWKGKHSDVLSMEQRMPTIVFKLNNFSGILFDESIALITCFGLFEYDPVKSLVFENTNYVKIIEELDNKKQISSSWISFSTGYELLFKSVLAKHKALCIAKQRVSDMKNVFLKGTSFDSVLKVYQFVKDARVSPDDDYLKSELQKNGITNIYDLSIGTLGSSIGQLNLLVDHKVIQENERAFLHAASHTLLDIRRNFDVHAFFPLKISRSLNGDLENVYLPAINLLLDIYHRPSV